MRSLSACQALSVLFGITMFLAGAILLGAMALLLPRGAVLGTGGWLWLALVATALIALAMALGHRVGSRVAFELDRLTITAREVVSGRLDVKPPTEMFWPELNTLGEEIGNLGGQMRSHVAALKEIVSALQVSATQTSSATAQLASAASEQAAAIAQTSSTTEEVRQTGMLAKESAQQIVSNAETSVAISSEGKTAAESSAEVMSRLQEQVEIIAQGIDGLRSHVGTVAEIITSVNEIAGQSNLLAVNASIEAAKAGEFGRGFSVVAQEVKNLAEQSRRATAQVRETLGNIQVAIEEVVHRAQSGRSAATTAVDSINHMGGVIHRLTSVIADTAGGARAIAVNANEQVIGLEQIAQAMASLNEAATENLKATRDVERTNEGFSSMAAEVNSLVVHYRSGN